MSHTEDVERKKYLRKWWFVMSLSLMAFIVGSGGLVLPSIPIGIRIVLGIFAVVGAAYTITLPAFYWFRRPK